MSDSTVKRVVVIGAGPGGYPAAFLAADLGMDVILIDPEPNPGGVCLYRGCIPTKTLLHGAEILREAKESEHLGIHFEAPRVDLERMRANKDGVIAKLTSGLGYLTKQRKIRYIQGKARFVNGQTLEAVHGDGQKETLTFDDAIIATGTRSMVLPFIDTASDRVMDSEEAMNLPDVPGSLLVIGGGYIGLELGTVYASLGTEVSVVDILPQLLPGADADLVRTFSMRARKTFKEILLKTKVVKVAADGEGVTVHLEEDKGGVTEKRFDKVLLTVGRTPNTDDLGLENTQVQLDGRGFIQVDAQRQTAEPHVWAIGDVVGGAMLAHKATAEGKAAVEALAGKDRTFAPKAIPAVLFTDPELCWVGVTEAEAKEAGLEFDVAKFNWAGSGRCLSLGRNDGVTKIISDKASGRVLGVGIVGPRAGELIAEGALAVENGLTVSQLAHAIHPHPTLSETMMEAAEVQLGMCTHVYQGGRK